MYPIRTTAWTTQQDLTGKPQPALPPRIQSTSYEHSSHVVSHNRSDPGSLSREHLLVYQIFFVSSCEHSSHGIKCAHECPHAKYSSTHILKTNCGRWRPILEVPVEHPTVPTSANNRASSAAKPAVTRPILPCLPSHPILPMKYHHVVPMTRKIPNSSPEGSPPTHCQRHSQKVDTNEAMVAPVCPTLKPSSENNQKTVHRRKNEQGWTPPSGTILPMAHIIA